MSAKVEVQSVVMTGASLVRYAIVVVPLLNNAGATSSCCDRTRFLVSKL